MVSCLVILIFATGNIVGTSCVNGEAEAVQTVFDYINSYIYTVTKDTHAHTHTHTQSKWCVYISLEQFEQLVI